MAEEEREDTDEELPEGLENIIALVESIEEESAEISSMRDEVRQAIGIPSTAEGGAILKLCDMLVETVVPMIHGVAEATRNAVADLFDEIQSNEDSLLTPEDAAKFSNAFLGAAQLIAQLEASTSDEEVKKQCQGVGEAISGCLKRIGEIVLVEEDEDEEDKDEEEDLN